MRRSMTMSRVFSSSLALVIVKDREIEKANNESKKGIGPLHSLPRAKWNNLLHLSSPTEHPLVLVSHSSALLESSPSSKAETMSFLKISSLLLTKSSATGYSSPTKLSVTEAIQMMSSVRYSRVWEWCRFKYIVEMLHLISLQLMIEEIWLQYTMLPLHPQQPYFDRVLLLYWPDLCYHGIFSRVE